MTHQNLILTEKAIGRHTKRLQKELLKLNHEFKLSETQNMLSRILGMNNYHELKEVLKFENKEEEKNSEKELDYYLNQKNFITLEHAEKNLENFFAKGNINIILDFLESANPLIQQYIKENSINFFNVAARNNQCYLLKTLINNNLINLTLFSEDEIKDLYWNLLAYNIETLESFNYIFYELNFPNKFSHYLIGLITHYLITNAKIPEQKNNLNKFLNDDRVNFQKNFFWNSCPIIVTKKDSNNIVTTSTEYDLSYCALNSVCVKGNLEIVKYLIEEQNVLPLENASTVSNACLSGNLDLVKYLITDIKAPFNYFQRNNPKKLSDRDLTYRLDLSTLASAINSENLELVEYLINYKSLLISDYDFLALRVALIESSSLYPYFFKIPECIDYIKNNSQNIFKEVIYKIHSSNNKNNFKIYQENQFNIAYELVNNYQVHIENVVTVNDNPKLINLLEQYKNKVNF